MAKFWAPIRNILHQIPLPGVGLSVEDIKGAQALLSKNPTLTEHQINKLLAGEASISDRGIYLEFTPAMLEYMRNKGLLKGAPVLEPEIIDFQKNSETTKREINWLVLIFIGFFTILYWK